MTASSKEDVPAAELRAKFEQILPHLDERCRRLYLASEAAVLGHGGIALVAAASGISTATIARGIIELETHPAPTRRIRASGAGRKPLTVTDPGLLPALESLIEPHTRGDPVSPLRWTTLSLRSLAHALSAQKHPIGATTVGHLLHGLGYSLQGTAKTTEGTRHPDRDAQFAHLNATAAAFLDDDQPVISIDTKAKEWLGNRDRPGRTWQPGKNPIKVDSHTLVTSDQPVAIPYGIYDLATNSGWVNVGTDHDTAEFAVESVRRWWRRRGCLDHPHATRLLITADAGGSNNPRYWTWKKQLHDFARESGLEITVCHFPPGTSKWNKIEHRMFCHITANWRGRPLTSYQVVIETIAATTTEAGLRVSAELDTGNYPLGTAVTPAEFHALPITPDGLELHPGPHPSQTFRRSRDQPTDRSGRDLDAHRSGPDRHAALGLRSPGADLGALLGRAGRGGLSTPFPPPAPLPPSADQQPRSLPPAPDRFTPSPQGRDQHPPSPPAGRHPHQPVQPVPRWPPDPRPAQNLRHADPRIARTYARATARSYYVRR
ncbi:hypothetical protein FHR32_002489 [Streptosporangium album]|uniref:ISAzo13 family transposase n=1 Tax=Streptosporangium album TaxID=47479 RepID=A0A7W7RTZ3_9ACTN|nr:hypothetical protein [Streptosporangium album]